MIWFTSKRQQEIDSLRGHVDALRTKLWALEARHLQLLAHLRLKERTVYQHTSLEPYDAKEQS